MIDDIWGVNVSEMSKFIIIPNMTLFRNKVDTKLYIMNPLAFVTLSMNLKLFLT